MTAIFKPVRRLLGLWAAWWCVEFTLGAITGWRKAGQP